MADTQHHPELFGAHFFDYGLPSSIPFFDESGRLVDMTQLEAFDDGYHAPDVLFDTANHSDGPNSPGDQSRHTAVEGGDSLSPDDAAGHILTPASTNLSPYNAELDGPDSGVTSGSPQSDDSVAGDYVRVSTPDRPCGQGQKMSQLAPRSTPRAVPSSQILSQPQNVSHPSSQTNRAMASSHWQQSFGISTSAGMDHLASTEYTNNFAPGSGDFPLFNDAMLLGVGNSDFTSAFALVQHSQQQHGNTNLPFRSHANSQHQLLAQAPSLAAFQHMSSIGIYSPQRQSTYSDVNVNASQPSATSLYTLNAGNLGHVSHQASTLVSQVSQPIPPTQPSILRSHPSAASQIIQNSRTQATQTHGHPRCRIEMRTAPTSSGGTSPTRSSATSSDYQSFNINGVYPAVAVADPARKQLSAPRVSETDRISKGGRKKNSHLPDLLRQRSHAMRKVGACWRCVMQRDPCDAPEGGCCSRCTMRTARGQAYFFDCDRSKLPEFLSEFLPASLLHDHQKRNIETFVSKEVVTWHMDNCIDVYLSSGYGPPLPWKLYEFSPRNHETLYQLQVVQDPQSKRTITTSKYSPPYGLLRIDISDNRNYESYLEDLLHPQWLQELGESAYADENEVDDGKFQCKVLDSMCNLYVNTQDATLKPLLGDVLRMIIITYIMGHTMTITEDTLYPVIANIRYSHRPPVQQKQTSPRLANRQLKFFFNGVRNGIYEKILKWQQHTLHTAGKKEETWLHAFCVTLGFAMVLEEVQRTMMCHAEAKICRGEGTLQAAYNEARQNCNNIDRRFKLLVGLFQCKYRDRKWTNQGSFGNATPGFRDPVAHHFLSNLRLLVDQRASHLRSRENVQFSLENQWLYTTRLTARFLLPFLNLPAA